jgi:hypothetical protein
MVKVWKHRDTADAGLARVVDYSNSGRLLEFVERVTVGLEDIAMPRGRVLNRLAGHAAERLGVPPQGRRQFAGAAGFGNCQPVVAWAKTDCHVALGLLLSAFWFGPIDAYHVDVPC